METISLWKNIQMNKLVLITLITILCTGCKASMYKAPIGSQTASLELNTDTVPVIVQHFKNEQCDRDPSGVRLAFLNNGIYGSDKNGVVKKIAANETFVMSFLYDAHMISLNKTCHITISFLPQENQSYKVNYYVDFKECHLQVLKQTKIGNKVTYKAEKSVKKLEKNCWDGWKG